MIFRHLRYLTALARTKHFGRAAEQCHVSQPTLSNAIRQFEQELGVRLIERGQRYEGLTREGERVVAFAKRVLADSDTLMQDLGAMTTGLKGQLRLGVVPSASPLLALVTSRFCQKQPGVEALTRTSSTDDIVRGLDGFDIDVGVAYLDDIPAGRYRSQHLYHEHLAVLTPISGPFSNAEQATWAEVAQVPLALLTAEFENRRLIDQISQSTGHALSPRIQTASMLNLAAHVRAGGWTSIVPRECFAFCAEPPGTRMIPLVEPETSTRVGLVMADHDPPPVLANAFLASAAEVDIDLMFV
ncbi:MAG: LysR family transcriptional regulator [Hyphomicrobiales bacterium]|nr:LysR family transcriptional regulator [Hyphomicrobiales bacterium]